MSMEAAIVIGFPVGLILFLVFKVRELANENQHLNEEVRLCGLSIRSLNQEIRNLKNPQPNLPELFTAEQFAKYHNRRWHDGNRKAVDKALKWDDNAKGES